MSGTSLTVMELCLAPGLGGLELYALRSAIALSQTYQVCAVLNPKGRLFQRFMEEGFVPVPQPRMSKHFPALAARGLARQIDEYAVDVIHVHWTKDLPLAVLAKGFSRRKPCLLHTRHMQITRPKHDLYHQWVYARVDHIIAITRDLEQRLKSFLGDSHSRKVSLLYHGAPEPALRLGGADIAYHRQRLGVPPRGFVVGIFGRIKHAKGQHLLLEALEQLSETNPDIHAILVGFSMEPDYMEELHRRAECAPLRGRIHFVDFSEEPQTLMQVCDAVALTSYEETFGMVLIEAMRAGVPVLGSDRGGVPEIITHQKTGLLFKSGDAKSLALQLTRLIEEPELRNTLAHNAERVAAQRFSWERHIDELAKIIQSSRPFLDKSA